MEHYRINKLARAGGVIVKRRDILATDDKQALQIAAKDPECPICEVRHAAKLVGTIA